MLVVHSDSSCDICLEPYTPTRIPHAIACGHIFCLFCLERCDPHICPICRKKYHLDRVKKLHVEAPHGAGQGNAAHTGFAEHLQMVAMVSGEGATDDEVESVLARVNEWMKMLPAHHMYIQPLRLALDSVLKARKTREDLEDALEQQHSVERRLNRLEEDLRTSRLVEESLLAQNEDTKQELDTLQLKYDYMLREDASSTRSRSSAGSVAETRSTNSDDGKAARGKKRTTVDVAYSITPGAPHAERVLPPPQRKQPHTSAISSSNEQRRREKGKRPEGSASAPPSGLGLFTSPDAESDSVGLRIEDVGLAMNHGSGSDPRRSWNGTGNALGVQMDGGDHRGAVRPEEWNRHTHIGATETTQGAVPMARNASSDSNLAELSILSPPGPSRTTDQLDPIGLGELFRGAHPTTDAATPQSTTSWGTSALSSRSSRSSFSVGDLELNGLPPLPSRSSLDLGLTGLDDFETGDNDSDGELEDEVMTPGASRPAALDSHFLTPLASRVVDASSVVDRRPQLRHTDRSRAGMTPRIISRSISDTTHAIPVGSRSMDADSEDELEVVAMRFSQSFSEIEPALSGLGSHSGGSTTFDDESSVGRAHRRRASTSAASGLAPLDMDGIDNYLEQGNSSGPLSAHAQLYGRSVTFSTPKPQPDTTRSQPTVLPPTSSRTHGVGPSLYASLVQNGHGKRPQTPKTVPATPFVSNTRVVASSSAANGGHHPMHRGAATVSAPLRSLPPASYDPTYTSVMPTNGHSLPPSQYVTPYVVPRTFQQNDSTNNVANAGTQQPSYTLQPVSATVPPESSTQPRSTTSPNQARPVLHAPQPVNGTSHIGRPWRDWAN